MSWLWGSSINPQYEELVEQACSPMKLQFPQDEDMALNLEITDMIRSKTVLPKPAMQSLKKRVASKNGRVQMYALSLVDTCIKNGGDHFLAEIASKEFVDEMTGLIRSSSTNPEVRTLALRLFQQWALAFQPKRELGFLVDMYNELKNSGIKFPPPPTGSSSHMIDTATAPAWVDSEFCMRCRSAFTFTNRKHHCRSCGLIFDQACSSRVMPLPKFGIKEEVRVCEGCWLKTEKNKPTPAVPGRTPRTRQDFDTDLQRAIELSLAQARPGAVPSEPPIAYKSGTAQDDDEQLRLAIEASLREMERARPSAPTVEEPEYKPLPTFDLGPRETETILTFTNTIDQMAAYGERDLRRFPQVHMLAGQAHALSGKLQRNSEEKTTKTQMLMEMQSKLNEAVALYGNILDGQAAYAQRKAHEAQMYAAQQQQKWAQPQQYGYQPHQQQPQQQLYSNGYHVPQQYAQPPQPQQYAESQQPQKQQQPQQQHTPATPAMYPSMPAYGYQPQQQQPQHYFQSQPWQPAPAAPSQSPSRQNSYASPAHSYAPPPAEYAAPAPEPQLPTGPPPIDLASHPSMSPRSVSSAMPPVQYAHAPAPAPAPSAPARSASYTSPIVASAPLASPEAVASAPYAPTPAHVASAPPPAQPVAAPAAPNPWSNAYTPAMFPSAPSGFADPEPAPAPAPREEALLIEL